MKGRKQFCLLCFAMFALMTSSYDILWHPLNKSLMTPCLKLMMLSLHWVGLALESVTKKIPQLDCWISPVVLLLLLLTFISQFLWFLLSTLNRQQPVENRRTQGWLDSVHLSPVFTEKFEAKHLQLWEMKQYLLLWFIDFRTFSSNIWHG